MASRLDAPVFGAPSDYHGPDKWEVTFSWRYQKSDKHFVGHEYQEERTTEQSAVVNTINQAEVTATRKYAHGWRVGIGIPYLMAERSSPIRDANGDVIDRYVTQARGMGDVVVGVKKWIWDPATPTKGNIALGIGVKIPIGENNVVDTRKRIDTTTGAVTLTEQTVDQSIQPGDGGFGLVFDVQMYRRFASDRFSAFGTATYLANPEGVSGVQTYRSAPGEEVMSIADQYLVRAGIGWYPGAGWGLSLGGRAEGVPVYDVWGTNDGFRRPGYAISVEPGVTWTHGAHTVALLVPIAWDRARLKSVSDRENGTHGDAAFADYVILAGYARRF